MTNLSYKTNRFDGEFPPLGKRTPAERVASYLAKMEIKNSGEYKSRVLKAKEDWKRKHGKIRRPKVKSE